MPVSVRRVAILLGLTTALTLTARLSPADGGDAPPSDPAMTDARAAIGREDFAAAIPRLNDYLQRHAGDADGWNWLGYAQRQQGRLNEAFAAYDKALAIDPKHRGAHEYLGEAHLQAGNLAAAERQLAVLDRLCLFPCREFTELKAAIAAYRARMAH